MTKDGIEEFIQKIGKQIQFYGCTSTSTNQDTALTFAKDDAEAGRHKVLFQIIWKREEQHYFLNAGAYDYEQEVLLEDGVELYVHEVKDIIQEQDNQKKKLYTLIVLGTERKEAE